MGYQIYRLLKGNAYGETFLGGLRAGVLLATAFVYRFLLNQKMGRK